MNMKLVCAAFGFALMMIAFGLEGGALTPGQAFIMSLPVAPVCLWSFIQTDWYDPSEKRKCS